MRTITEIHDENIRDITLLTAEEVSNIETTASEGRKLGLNGMNKEQFLAIKITKRLQVWNR